MMYLYENLRDKALELINTKSTIDDIKAERDLIFINDTINEINIFPQNIKEGIALDAQLNEEYPEIQWLRDAANTMIKNNGTNSKQILHKTLQKSVVDDLRTDYFGVLASILVKHNIIYAVKDFIRAVE